MHVTANASAFVLQCIKDAILLSRLIALAISLPTENEKHNDTLRFAKKQYNLSVCASEVQLSAAEHGRSTTAGEHAS